LGERDRLDLRKKIKDAESVGSTAPKDTGSKRRPILDLLDDANQRPALLAFSLSVPVSTPRFGVLTPRFGGAQLSTSDTAVLLTETNVWIAGLLIFMRGQKPTFHDRHRHF